MDCEALDRAASRAVIRLTYSNGVTLWLADNREETATDIPANVKRFHRLAEAWAHVPRLEQSFRDATVEAVSVVELWNR
jgi:hypothetical protein